MNPNTKNILRSSFLKRIIDILSALVLFVLFLPIWIILPLLIKIDSPGPIFYRHKRVGKAGKEFYLYKFRSMIADADKVLYKENPKLLKKFKASDWKLKNDPRITKLGRLMRNLTLDEFPQLWNVLKGDMSLVGPRAYIQTELDEQVKKYPETKKYLKNVLSVKPGLTGPWQVSGRNEIPFDKRVKIDNQYAIQHNLAYDIIIMLKTPQAMISKW